MISLVMMEVVVLVHVQFLNTTTLEQHGKFAVFNVLILVTTNKDSILLHSYSWSTRTAIKEC